MNEAWSGFLNNAGAVVANGKVAHFGNADRERRAAVNGNVMVDLSHLGLIAVSGKDAQSFLQNQFCNDVRAIDGSSSQLNGHCSAKGRLLSIFRLLQIADTYYMELPADIVEATLKKLRMFVLRSQVTLEDRSDALVRIGCSGPQADQLLAQAAGCEPPSTMHRVKQHAGLTLVRVGDAPARFEIWGEAAALQNLWMRLDVHAAPVGSDVWEWLEIQSGIPAIHADTVDAFVPQMVNLESLGGVSFNKGCYPGQEVVARMRYLGTLKRRMYLAHVDADQAPRLGDNLHAAGGESGQGSGKVVRVQAAPDGGYDLLAVIVIDVAAQHSVHLQDQNGPVLQLKPLPYTFESYGNVSGG